MLSVSPLTGRLPPQQTARWMQTQWLLQVWRGVMQCRAAGEVSGWLQHVSWRQPQVADAQHLQVS